MTTDSDSVANRANQGLRLPGELVICRSRLPLVWAGHVHPLALMSDSSSPHMLLFHLPTPERLREIDPRDREELVNRWNEWYDGLLSRRKLQHGHPLQPQARVISGPKGERVMDGPFAEAKEAVGGYFFLNVSWEEATEIARQCPGLPYGFRVEIRPVAERCNLGQLHNEPARSELASASSGPA